MTQIDEANRGRTDVSDRALRVFLAVVEAGSFTAAAARLGLGQPAVSHAVARLEAALSTRLLDRSRTGVAPTAAGAELAAALAPALAAVDEAVRRARHDLDAGAVTLVVSTSLAAWWLLPRLPEFKRLHPSVELRLVTADADVGIDVSGLDLWIPLGIVERADLVATRFCDEAVVPVAAPAVAAQISGAGPADLTSVPLLHLEERYRSRFDWPRWFDHHGVSTGPLPGDRSNDYSLVIQAALEGQGVALGWWHIVADLVDQGRLTALADPVVTDQPFTVVHARHRPLRPGAVALRQWLANTMAASEALAPGAGEVRSQPADGPDGADR